jgi:hypothetical protein
MVSGFVIQTRAMAAGRLAFRSDQGDYCLKPDTGREGDEYANRGTQGDGPRGSAELYEPPHQMAPFWTCSRRLHDRPLIPHDLLFIHNDGSM